MISRYPNKQLGTQERNPRLSTSTSENFAPVCDYEPEQQHGVTSREA